MFTNTKIIFIVFILGIYFILYFNSNYQLTTITKNNSNSNLLLFNDPKTRDFYRYDCQNLKRIGGEKKLVESAPNDLYRYLKKKVLK